MLGLSVISEVILSYEVKRPMQLFCFDLLPLQYRYTNIQPNDSNYTFRLHVLGAVCFDQLVGMPTQTFLNSVSLNSSSITRVRGILGSFAAKDFQIISSTKWRVLIWQLLFRIVSVFSIISTISIINNNNNSSNNLQHFIYMHVLLRIT